MDNCRFDNWTRMLGTIRDRRTALKEFTGASAALVALARADLGFAAQDDVLVEGCRLSGERCKRNNNCCSGVCDRKRRKKKKNRDEGGNGKRRNKKGDGECKCLDNGKSCRKDAACCKGRCDQSDGRCRCTPANDTCNKDTDCCRGKCVADNQGNKFCKAG